MSNTNPMGIGLAVLNRIASSPAIDRLGLRKATERAVYQGAKSGFQAAGTANRTFKRVKGSGKPTRQSTSGDSGVFDLTPTEDQEMIVGVVQEFADEVLRPAAAEADENDVTSKEVLAQTSEFGLTLLNVPGASRVGTSIQIEDPDGQGLAAWIDALVVGSGGTLLDGAGRSPRIGLDSEAGQGAADVVRSYAASDLGPGPSADAVRDFVTTPGSFLLAPTSVISDPRLASIAGDMQWTAYPVVDTDPAVPVTGVSLAVPLYAKHTKQSYDAIECLTSDASMQQMMLSSGHSAARASLYDTREVQAGYPMAAVAKTSMEDGLTLPQTPYWNRVRDALVDTWLPVGDVDASTPATSQRAVRDEVAGRLR